ncbi:hypothetical protein HN832_00730 [archaeon]|jgi:hypothetical protein|nr:hypothetical protein [archaeon]MBT4373853.1 hypothetical protein [archaeon]MBT4532375.1 hypothetical protein [archaeon]MBT7001756.1 hypothetical protein [archaeon]MBT7281919.1 hypothetical protein [archaeon]
MKAITHRHREARKMKRGLLFDKRGEKNDMISPIIIYTIGNILFFTFLIIFIARVSTGTLNSEQLYAKEIALLIDGATPGMELEIDFTEGYKIASKNNVVDLKGNLEVTKLVKIDNEANLLMVSLSSSGGYKFHFFSDYEVGVGFKLNEDKIVLKIK